jgi:hypothetical protein
MGRIIAELAEVLNAATPTGCLAMAGDRTG